MKILIFNWQDIRNPLAGGAEVHLHEIFSRVAGMGHEVTLFCSSFEGAPKEETIGGIRVVREGGRYLFNFLVPLRYRQRFRREGYDVVIDDLNKIPFLTPLYVREPLALIVHHLFDTVIFREAIFPLALYVYLAERAGVALYRRSRIPVFAVSPSTKEVLLNRGFGASGLEIVPNCVDHGRFRPTGVQRSGTPLIGYMGRLKKYKSVDHLLRAFAILLRGMPDAKLVVIGEGDDRSDLERSARQLGMEASVRFTGFVSEEEKVRLLQEVWFLVNPSSVEGWGLTVIEANACGTPVIASDVPGLRDAVKDGETGILYPYGNIEVLAEQMIRLAGDSRLRNALAKGAVEWAGTFDWQRVAEQTVALLLRQARREN
jgi:glycosyltransferase involved in cell wall biosynthesis